MTQVKARKRSKKRLTTEEAKAQLKKSVPRLLEADKKAKKKARKGKK